MCVRGFPLTDFSSATITRRRAKNIEEFRLIYLLVRKLFSFTYNSYYFFQERVTREREHEFGVMRIKRHGNRKFMSIVRTLMCVMCAYNKSARRVESIKVVEDSAASSRRKVPNEITERKSRVTRSELFHTYLLL